MKSIFKILPLLFLLSTNCKARTLFLISHENRPKEALLLKETLKRKFNIPDEFLTLSTQASCVANKKVILHLCLVKDPKEEYKILYLNKKIMTDSFLELSEGKENGQ